MGNKLFKPNDFTKDIPKKPWYKKTSTWLWGIPVLVGIAGGSYYYSKDNNGNPNDTISSEIKSPITQIVDTPAVIDDPHDTISTDTSNVQVTGIVNGTSKPHDGNDSMKGNSGSSSGGIQQGTNSEDVTIKAKKAIRGDFGNGAERRRKLGSDYDQVQALVNKMYREGNLSW